MGPEVQGTFHLLALKFANIIIDKQFDQYKYVSS